MAQAHSKKIAVISSQRNEKPGRHCIGTCMRHCVPDPKKVEALKAVLSTEFRSSVGEVGSAVVNGCQIIYVRFSSVIVGETGLQHKCRRFGKLVVKHGLAKKVEVAGTLPSPRPNLVLV